MACILEEAGERVTNNTLKMLKLPAAALKRREDTILELYQMYGSTINIALAFVVSGSLLHINFYRVQM